MFYERLAIPVGGETTGVQAREERRTGQDDRTAASFPFIREIAGGG